MVIKVANYIADFLTEQGINHTFTVTGGGAMHLNDAFGHKEGMHCVYNHHEQASAIAAESYYRIAGKLACLCVTSGPGGTNAITGVIGGWLDSIPILVISGQVKYEMTIEKYPELNIRQLGDQEFNIIDTVKNFTKYSTMIINANEISYHLEKAIFLSRQGKGGPVWLDIPLDVQGARIDTDQLIHFDPVKENLVKDYKFTSDQAQNLIDKITKAKAPLLLVGSGVRYGRAEDSFLQLVNKLDIPVVTAWASNDLLSREDKHFIGTPGTLGTRSANFALQRCDLLISLGSRLNVRTVGYNKGDFARNAYKVMIEICEAELYKPTFVPDLPICANVRDVIEELLKIPYERPEYHNKWFAWCNEIYNKYPVVVDRFHNLNKNINPYVFTEILYQHLSSTDTIVSSNGTSCVVPIQVSGIKQGQRYICNSGCAAMGYGLPAALGAAIAKSGGRVICLEGDGSIMMNIQELPTIKQYGLNIKVFIYNNNGYHSIRQTQMNNFGEPLVGVNKESGVAIPEYRKLADAFDIPYVSIQSEEDAEEKVLKVLEADGVSICEVFVDWTQNFEPKSSAKVLPDGSIVSPSIDEMAPFLPKEEYEAVIASWKA